MIKVPDRFKVKHPSRYPEDNETEFERWFLENWKPEDARERHYLPVLWTGYFVRHKYGRDFNARQHLQRFLRGLDRRHQYYSIIQYDSGPLVPVPPNVKLFAMSGPVVHYPLPLICQPHQYFYRVDRDIFANFVGAMTHKIRRSMMSYLQGKPGYMVTQNKMSLGDFCSVLSRSVFTLCPRGFGETSFRIQEALQYGSIPVYISDKFILPHNLDFNEYGVLINQHDVSRVDEILKSIPPEEIRRKQENGRLIYEQYFTYEACKRLILQNI